MPQPTVPSDPPGAGVNGRLNTWKEIAAYLGKGVRTVERWEAYLGLPVHRVHTKRGENVYAFAHEIDAWLKTVDRKGTLEGEPWQESELPPAPSTTPGATPRRRWPARRLLWWGPVVAAALVLVWLHVRPNGWLASSAVPPASQTPTTAAPAPRLPATWRLVDGQVAVFDDEGRSLWHTDLTFKFRPDEDAARLMGEGRILLQDIDGNGERELLVVACEGRTFYCFNANGKTRFASGPTRTVRFGSVDQAPPFTVSRFWVTAEPGRPSAIWLAANHQLGAGVVERLDTSGNVQSEYWGYGRVTAVLGATIGGRRLALIGATDAESRGSSLVVADYAASATAPAKGDQFRCSNCPGAAPAHFFVFPPDAVSRATGRARSVIDRIDFDAEDHRVTVRASARATIGSDKAASEWAVLYTFNEAFDLVDVDFTEAYQSAHTRLQRLGLLRHPFGAQDLREASRVLRWDGAQFAPVQTKGEAAAPPSNQ